MTYAPPRSSSCCQPALLVLVLDCKSTATSPLPPSLVATLLATLALIHHVPSVTELTATVASLVPAVRATAAVRGVFAVLAEEEQARLVTEYLSLAYLLQGDDTKWRRSREEVVGEDGTLALVAELLKRQGSAGRGGHPGPGQERPGGGLSQVALQGAGAQHCAGTGRSKEGRVGETRGFPDPATAPTPAPATAPVPSSVLAPSPGDP